jgi:hypothetical protein
MACQASRQPTSSSGLLVTTSNAMHATPNTTEAIPDATIPDKNDCEETQVSPCHWPFVWSVSRAPVPAATPAPTISQNLPHDRPDMSRASQIDATSPNARAVMWPDMAHMIGMEAPDRLNALILDFLAPLRPWD